MVAFWGDATNPSQEVVDPRKTIRLNWSIWAVSDVDDPIVFIRVYWKPATVVGWTAPSVKFSDVGPEVRSYDLPAYTFPIDSAFSWRAAAFVVDRRYNPSLPDPQYYDPDPSNPSDELILLSGTPKESGQTNANVDTSGFMLSQENNSTVASGSALGAGIVSQIPFKPSDPGMYEVQISAQNGFQWSNWSALTPLVMYDTRKWVRKNGVWTAVPEYKKTAGSMKIVISGG